MLSCLHRPQSPPSERLRGTAYGGLVTAVFGNTSTNRIASKRVFQVARQNRDSKSVRVHLSDPVVQPAATPTSWGSPRLHPIASSKPHYQFFSLVNYFADVIHRSQVRAKKRVCGLLLVLTTPNLFRLLLRLVSWRPSTSSETKSTTPPITTAD